MREEIGSGRLLRRCCRSLILRPFPGFTHRSWFENVEFCLRDKPAQSGNEPVAVNGISKDVLAILWNSAVANHHASTRKPNSSNACHILPCDFLHLPKLALAKTVRVQLPVGKDCTKDVQQNRQYQHCAETHPPRRIKAPAAEYIKCVHAYESN